MSTLKVTNIQATGETATRSVSGIAAAWVSLDMSISSINDSTNVSSATDNGVGDFYMNFSNNMANTNYIHTSGASHGSGATTVLFTIEGRDDTADTSIYQTSLFNMDCVYVNSTINRTNFDIKRASVSIHGDLA